MLSQYKSSEISVLGHNQPSKLLYEKGIKRKIFADLEEYGFIMGVSNNWRVAPLE